MLGPCQQKLWPFLKVLVSTEISNCRNEGERERDGEKGVFLMAEQKASWRFPTHILHFLFCGFSYTHPNLIQKY